MQIQTIDTLPNGLYVGCMEKKCETCGDLFRKKPKDSAAQWADRSYCSAACSNDGKKDKPPHLRFWEHAGVSDGDNCWHWHGTKDQHGYGRIPFRTKALKAHRVSFEMRYGPIPDEYLVLHKCDNPSCVNPLHLEAGTQKKNMQDAYMRGRLNKKSLANLRPGIAGQRGAGPKSNGEIKNGG